MTRDELNTPAARLQEHPHTISRRVGRTPLAVVACRSPAEADPQAAGPYRRAGAARPPEAVR